MRRHELRRTSECHWDSVEAQIPEELWIDVPPQKKPKEPEGYIDNMADQLELRRLVNMGDIKQAGEDDKEVTRSVTTKFVRDWRWKGEGPARKRWLRRSRLVAREFPLDKRDDVFSPASCGHLFRLLPVLYLAELGGLKDQRRIPPGTSGGTLEVEDVR